jgi:hypothetical protein
MKEIHNRFWFLIIIILLLGFVLANTNVVDANIFTISTPETIKKLQAYQLYDALSSARDPETIKALQEKLAPIETTLKLRATAQALQPPTLEQICANRIPVVISKTMMETGILPVREDFLATQNLKINNMFRGYYKDQIVEVYAGHQYQEDQKGLVIVSIENLNIYQYFYDPTASGSLEIINDHNLRLELKSSRGSILYFDIPSMQFVTSQEIVVKSAALPPTPTPFQDPCAKFDQP